MDFEELRRLRLLALSKAKDSTGTPALPQPAPAAPDTAVVSISTPRDQEALDVAHRPAGGLPVIAAPEMSLAPAVSAALQPPVSLVCERAEGMDVAYPAGGLPGTAAPEMSLVPAVSAASQPTVNLVCVSAQDLLALIQKAQAGFPSAPKSSASSSFLNADVAGFPFSSKLHSSPSSSAPVTAVNKGRSPSPDVLLMDGPSSPRNGVVGSSSPLSTEMAKNNASKSPIPDYSWLMETSPRPVFKTTMIKPEPITSSAAAASEVSCLERANSSTKTAVASKSTSRISEWSSSYMARSRSESPEDFPCSQNAKASWKSCPLKAKSRSPSPDFSFLDEPASKGKSSGCNNTGNSSWKYRSSSPEFSFVQDKPSSSTALKKSPQPETDEEKWSTLAARAKLRSPSPDYSFQLDEPLSAASKKSPQRKWKPSLAARAKSRSPSPDFSWISTRNKSPSPPKRSEKLRKSSSASKAKSRSPSPDFSFLDRPSRTSTWNKSPSPPRRSEKLSSWKSSSTFRAKSRSPSPDFSFLDRSSRTSTRNKSPSPPRRSGKLSLLKSSSTSREKSRSPSPDFSFLDRPSRTSSRDKSPSPPRRSEKLYSWKSSSTSKAKSRSPSPDFSFLDRPSRTYTRNKSPSPPRRFGKPSLLKSSSTSREKSRSPSPDSSCLDRPSSSATSRRSTSSSTALMHSRRSSAASKSESRSPSPHSWSSSMLGTRKRKSNDPDYSPTNKSTKPKPPPKKRGRPPKKKENGTICPVCKEPASGKLSNTKCGHFFHEECLNGWLATPGQLSRDLKVCPTCGSDFDITEVNPIFL